MSPNTHFDHVEGNVTQNQARRDNIHAERDAVAGDKIVINYPHGKNNFVPDTSFLPYLLNRLRQERALVEAIKNHTTFDRPLICIIQGQKEDCAADGFIKRVKDYILPKIPSIQTQLNNKPCASWGVRAEDFTNKTELHDFMRMKLGYSIIQNSTASLNDICTTFSYPVLLYQTLAKRECYAGVETVKHLLEFWREKFLLPAGHRHLVLICLFVYQETLPKAWYQFSKKYRQQQQIEQIAQILTTYPDCLVLESLQAITEEHLEGWAQSDDVKAFFKRSIHNDVCRYLKENKHNIAQGIPLENLADSLTDLLKKLAQEVPR